MKILIASDIHGDSSKADFIKKLEDINHFDQIIICGDIYHQGYFSIGDVSSSDIANTFSYLVTKLHLIKGNNDYEEDNIYSPVYLVNTYEFQMGNYHIYCYHGHKNYFKTDFIHPFILCQGHTHRASVKFNKDSILCNPGSIGLPRDATGGTYIILTNSQLTIYKLDGSIFSKVDL